MIERGNAAVVAAHKAQMQNCFQPHNVESLLYVSQGNVPSRKAHATQACHMAAAFSELIPRVELVTQAPIVWQGSPTINVATWYGLPDRLAIRRLPVSARSITDGEGFIDRVSTRFARCASLYCRFRQPDLVYTRLPQAAVNTCRAGLPTLLETHDPPDGRFAVIARAAGGPSFRGLVTISPALRDLYSDHGVPADKIHIAPDGANPRPFDEANASLTRRRDLQRLVVGYCGHFYEGRGIDLLLACAHALPEIDLRLMGGFPDDVDHWKRLGRDIPHVSFTGFIRPADVPAQLAECDVLCMPYTRACPNIHWMSPMKMFEYMAAGKPILASDFPAVRNILVHEHNAILCSPDIPQQWIQSIQRFQQDKSLRLRLGQQARSDVAKYTWVGRAQDILRWLRAGRTLVAA